MIILLSALAVSFFYVLNLNMQSRCLASVSIRDVGLPWQRPDAEEIPVYHDEERNGERRPEEEVEVAANPTEQGGWKSKCTTTILTNDALINP